VINGSAVLPWIDHVDSGFPEVFGVARGQRRAAGSADGGYLGKAFAGAGSIPGT
jgi:hypothetical protein